MARCPIGYMHGRVLALLAVAWLALTVQAAAQIADDPFEAMHRSEVARNEPGRTVTIRTRDGRTTFQPREPIEIELAITPANGSNVDPRIGGCDDVWITMVVFDPADAVSQPQRPIDCGGPGERMSAGVVGGMMMGQQPWTMTFWLNAAYRIDRPGRLRLFARSRHTHLGDPLRHEASNVLILDIQPRDAAWEAQAAARAATVLDDPAATPDRVNAALASLGVLATPEAARILLHRVDAQGRRPSLHGLFVLDDRALAIRLMEQELERADRPVDSGYIGLLAQLVRASRHPDGVLPHDELRDLVERYSLVRARVLAGTSSTRLREAIVADFQRSTEWDGGLYGEVAAAIQHYPGETALAITWLDEARLEKLLRYNPRRFTHAAFLPLLRRLEEIYPREIASLALRYLFAVAPDEGRTRILDELARDIPRVTIETLGLLSDATLPQLEGAWIELLETSPSTTAVTAAAQRLERYGTVTGAARVAKAWTMRHDEWVTDVDGPLFAYLARVDAGLAERTLAVAAADPETLHGAGRDQALPLAIGRFEWNATVERFAIASLASTDDAVARQAAAALARYGSAAGRPAIAAALRRLRANWPRDEDAYAEQLEGDFAEALTSAVGWRLSVRSRAVAYAACMGERCRYQLRAGQEPDFVEREIYMRANAEDERQSAFSLDDVELASVPALIAKMRQYPPGTRFSFDPMRVSPTPGGGEWTERGRQALFEDVRSAAARYGIVIVRERTPLRPRRQSITP